jgi:hypothetical protein
MLRQVQLIILSFLLLVLFGCAHKQRTVAHVPGGSEDATAIKLFKGVLASDKFSFGHYSLPMCAISGPEGPCGVEAFLGDEANEDESKYTCAKFDRATYVGHCVSGRLDGLSLVNVDGTKKFSKEAFISYFHEGKIAYPALTSYVSGTTNFGAQEELQSYGCVYFGEWDRSSERCSLFIEVYGKDLFSEANARAIRDGTFDLNHYRAKFIEFVEPKQ